MSIHEQERKRRANAIAILAGGILITVGTMLPWLIAWQPATGTIVLNGLGNGTGDGVVQLPLGIVLGVFGLASLAGPVSHIAHRVIAVVAVISLVIGYIDYQYISAKVANQLATGFSMQMGIGVYAILAGGLAAVIGAARAGRKRQEDASNADRA